jgi:hypothetical protein
MAVPGLHSKQPDAKRHVASQCESLARPSFVDAATERLFSDLHYSVFFRAKEAIVRVLGTMDASGGACCHGCPPERRDRAALVDL